LAMNRIARSYGLVIISIILLIVVLLPIVVVPVAASEPPYIPYEVVLYKKAETYTGNAKSYITVTLRTEKGANIEKTVGIPWDGYGVAAAVLLGIEHVSTKLRTSSGEQLSLIAGVGAAFYTKGSKHEFTVQNGDYYYHVVQKVSVVPSEKYYFTGEYGEIRIEKTFKVYASSEVEAAATVKAELELFGIGGGIEVKSVSRVGTSAEYAVTVSFPVVKYYSDVIFKGSFIYAETVNTNAPLCPLGKTAPIGSLDKGSDKPSSLLSTAKFAPTTSCTYSTSKDFDLRYGYIFLGYKEINK